MRRVQRTFFVICLILMGSFSSLVFADGIRLRQMQFEPLENSWTVNASFQIDLPNELAEAVQKGIIFHFVTEFNVTRGRWYWLEEKPIQAIKNIRLSYQPLTQQYRVSVGGLSVSSNTIEEALIQVGSIGGWQVAELSALTNNRDYEGHIRMRLDLSQLPKPFQINALNAREWNIASDWHTFAVIPHYRTPNSK